MPSPLCPVPLLSLAQLSAAHAQDYSHEGSVDLVCLIQQARALSGICLRSAYNATTWVRMIALLCRPASCNVHDSSICWSGQACALSMQLRRSRWFVQPHYELACICPSSWSDSAGCRLIFSIHKKILRMNQVKCPCRGQSPLQDGPPAASQHHRPGARLTAHWR